MSKYTKQYTIQSGLPPGALVHVGKKVSEDTLIEVFDYNEQELEEYDYHHSELSDFEALLPREQDKIRWINVDGLSRVDIIERLGKSFGIHPLVMEDILNTRQRPKIENYEDYLYIVVKMVYYDGDAMIDEQLSIILGNGYLISFGEKKGDVFELIRERIRKDGGRIRKCGADYLAYALIDAVVDGYFDVLERMGDGIDEAEEELLSNPTIEKMHRLREFKRDLLYLHKSIWPLREVTSWMEREDTPLIKESTQIYIRDVYDHVIQSMDTTETFRDLLAGLMDIYLSSISNKMNEVMKVLTIISTIFIPLTFIAGVYGMNFQHMPELQWKWGYLTVMLCMAVIAGGMILYFRRKKWF